MPTGAGEESDAIRPQAPTRVRGPRSEDEGMNRALTEGQLSILHSLHDGDDPILRAPDADLIYYVRDVRLLVDEGLIRPQGKGHVLTSAAREVLDALHGMR